MPREDSTDIRPSRGLLSEGNTMLQTLSLLDSKSRRPTIEFMVITSMGTFFGATTFAEWSFVAFLGSGLRHELRRWYAVTMLFLGLKKPGALGGQGVEKDPRRVGHIRTIDGLDSLKFCETLRDANQELLVVLLLGVVCTKEFAKEPLQVSIQGNITRRRANRLHIPVHAQFRPLHPDALVGYTVEVFAILVLEEIVDREDYRRSRQTLTKVQMVLDITPQRNGHKVEIGHRLVCPNALLPKGRGCSL